MAAPLLHVAVFGDSVIEGQGLLDKDKFTSKASQEIGNLLGRLVDIVVNTARSGAPIKASSTAVEEKKKRAVFVDTYPGFFNTANLRNDFIEKDIQEVALLLTPELPANFPTVSYQVRRMGEKFPKSTLRSVELIFLGGGANDLDFQEYLNPEDHRDDYAKFYENRFEDYFYIRLKAMISQARALFPNAVIVYTGLYTPFLPGISNGAVKELFEHESGKPGWQIWLNNNIIEIKNIDQLVLEAQYRSLHGLTRGLYWMRRTIAEINEDPQLRGRGVIFVHPQFGKQNTVFESNSFIHKEYQISEVRDAVRNIRENLCPRNEFREEMERLWFSLQVTLLENPLQSNIISDGQEEALQSLLKKLDGPASMLEAFQGLLEVQDSFNLRKAVELLGDDLNRINNARRASFLHPNEKGAQRYTDMIVNRYKERHHQIRFREDLRKLQKSGSPARAISPIASMSRFGFHAPYSLRSITQHMEVDSIRLDVTTASDSAKNFVDDLILDMGGDNRWDLRLPVRLFTQPAPRIDFIQPQLVPGTTDTFTIDAMGVHLGSLTRFIIERRFPQFLENKEVFFTGFGFDDVWKPTHITLQINGRVVFDVPFDGALARGGKLTLPYPG